MSNKDIHEKLNIQKPDPMATKLMWFGVIFFSVIIGGIAVWTVTNSIISLDIDNTPENRLIEESKAQWDELFNQSEKPQSIKETLNNIISSSTTSTVNTSSTLTSTTQKQLKQEINNIITDNSSTTSTTTSSTKK